MATDARIGTLQLYQTGDEVSMPILSLREPRTLTLEFDILDDLGPRSLDIEFRRIDREGGTDLLPTEYLTAFDRDDILDAEPSGATGIPYTHYSYSFPNASIGFKLGGEYALRVSESGGAALFEMPFFVSEDLVRTELLLGTRLAETGAVGDAIQPAARLTPQGSLSREDAFRFTVCFARNGNVRALRCAPEPSLAEQAIYGFYLPRAQAFPPAEPLYALDLGGLNINEEVRELNVGTIPPEAVLEVDQAAFGGEFLDPGLLTAAEIDGAFFDAGRPDSDGEYVETLFRYEPQTRSPVTGPVYLQGVFTSGAAPARTRMTWVPEFNRYEGTFLVKQGRYAYQYAAPRATPRQRPIALGQPTVFTAFVFFEDLTRFTQRLVGVESVVAR
ncbi:hypothetical protein BSZ36_08365 [Rubricoccus marinus]|uniref:Type 9 secretion system plug protein N-terminal domain-containing protein n=1 Tax=Rubricoccus marinus TaxID=716817 RepID=A0A259U3S0_9BACT|nr:hypothetical protein BSZ36_08365 [Rubricoccus marinus]